MWRSSPVEINQAPKQNPMIDLNLNKTLRKPIINNTMFTKVDLNHVQ